MVAVFDRASPPHGGQLGDWPATQLSPAHRDFLAGFEPTVEVSIDGLGPALFCHGTPASDEAIITPETPEEIVAAALAETDLRLVVAGHTHMQLDRQVGDRRLVNAGSVGMPYADLAGAYWALLGPAIELRRTTFDFQAAAAAVRGTGHPGREDLARGILDPPSAREATAVFERQAGRTL
jgi:diadenosine tetraphosphatase ApaH/serine/threonine PP2A family protein phosphatase